MKNANGTGSIRKRSDGRWEARYTAPDGVQRSVYGRSKQAVVDSLKRKQAEIMTGTYLTPSKTTLEAWVNVWLEEYSPHLRPTTKALYMRSMRCHVLPALGRIRLSQLKTIHIQRLVNGLAERLAPSTVKNVRQILSTCLSTAERFELIHGNPCKNLTMPPLTEKKMHIIDREQFQTFFDLADQTSCGTCIRLMLLTGLRRGEVRGLRWADLNGNTLTVERQLADDFSLPKSGKSRSIVLFDEAVEMLHRHKREQAEMRLQKRWVDTDITRDLIFRQDDGSPYSIQQLFKAVRWIGGQMGIQALHPHDLRHSYAVAALRAGIDVKTVQNNLGHATAAMTLDVYAKYTDDMGQEAAKKLGEYVRKNSGLGSG